MSEQVEVYRAAFTGDILCRCCNSLHSVYDIPESYMRGNDQQWYSHGYVHRDGDEPAIIQRPCNNNNYFVLQWFQKSKRQRSGAPAYIDSRENSMKRWMHINSYCNHGDLHREDGPSRILISDDDFMSPDPRSLKSPYMEPHDSDPHTRHLNVHISYYLNDKLFTEEEFKNRYEFVFMKPYQPPTKKEVIQNFFFAKFNKRFGPGKTFFQDDRK